MKSLRLSRLYQCQFSGHHMFLQLLYTYRRYPQHWKTFIIHINEAQEFLHLFGNASSVTANVSIIWVCTNPQNPVLVFQGKSHKLTKTLVLCYQNQILPSFEWEAYCTSSQQLYKVGMEEKLHCQIHWDSLHESNKVVEVGSPGSMDPVLI